MNLKKLHLYELYPSIAQYEDNHPIIGRYDHINQRFKNRFKTEALSFLRVPSLVPLAKTSDGQQSISCFLETDIVFVISKAKESAVVITTTTPIFQQDMVINKESKVKSDQPQLLNLCIHIASTLDFFLADGGANILIDLNHIQTL